MVKKKVKKGGMGTCLCLRGKNDRFKAPSGAADFSMHTARVTVFVNNEHHHSLPL